ncbi:cupin domain-containing protein [Kribbella sp. NPDC051620]|uniref:cupin domain-containing protein n=1 Tax=Kribbella sp. NPDC051620 TaxID=3364120 RepID=UPI00379868E9
MKINPGHRGTVMGDALFTGEVWIDHLARPGEDTSLSVQQVYFTPGARTPWHEHPEGQVINVIAGVGRIQERNGPVHTIRAGDTVTTPPGEWHWHGAAADSAMTMIAIQGADRDGGILHPGEPVTDAEYDA